MKRSKLIYLGVTFLQVALLLVLFVLEYLSGYKAGLAQHLYFKKVYYISHYYQGTPLALQTILLFFLTTIVFGIGVRNRKETATKLCKYFIIFTGLLTWFFTSFTRDLNVYTHVLMALQFCLLLEIVAFTLSFFKPNE